MFQFFFNLFAYFYPKRKGDVLMLALVSCDYIYNYCLLHSGLPLLSATFCLLSCLVNIWMALCPIILSTSLWQIFHHSGWSSVMYIHPFTFTVAAYIFCWTSMLTDHFDEIAAWIPKGLLRLSLVPHSLTLFCTSVEQNFIFPVSCSDRDY